VIGTDHFVAMSLYALLTAAFFALLWRSGRRERWKYFLFVILSMLLGAIAAGWVMYPVPPHP
jgi:cytochrome bd-type quinol oxidase subunit 2